MNRRQLMQAAAGLVPMQAVGGLMLAGPGVAAAQSSAATGRLLVGFAPGGAGDFVARTVAEQLRARGLAGQVVVENRPGAGGVLAVQAMKSLPPDGLTLLNTPASVLTILPHAHRRPPFDTLADLTPVATVSDLDFALVAGSATPGATLAEVLAAAKRDPKVALYGTAGVGTMSHVIGAMLARRSGVELVHVAYKGGSPALQDAIAGQVPLAILAVNETMLRARQDGRLKILATSGAQRSRFLTDVPTLQEAGHEGVVASDWNTIVAPPRMAPAVVARLSALVQEMAADRQFAADLARFYLTPLKMGHEEMAARLHKEYEAMGRLIKQEGITVES
jgi:tripartite-type tricarboxylate transporter receptor subunit TctC